MGGMTKRQAQLDKNEKLARALDDLKFDDFRMALSSGADPNMQYVDGSRIIMAATARGAHVFVKTLIDAGAEISKQDQYGWSPAHTAVFNNNPEILALLLESGADADSSGIESPPLTMALRLKKFRCAEVLLDHGAKTIRNGDAGASLMEESRQTNAPKEFIEKLARHIEAELLSEESPQVKSKIKVRI